MEQGGALGRRLWGRGGETYSHPPWAHFTRTPESSGRPPRFWGLSRREGGRGWLLGGTVSQACEWFQHTPLESGHRVLHTRPEAQHALELGLPYQQVSVGGQLMGPAEQSGDAVHELGHQARVGVVGLAVVVGHDLQKKRSRQQRPILFTRHLAGSPSGMQFFHSPR